MSDVLLLLLAVKCPREINMTGRDAINYTTAVARGRTERKKWWHPAANSTHVIFIYNLALVFFLCCFEGCTISTFCLIYKYAIRHAMKWREKERKARTHGDGRVKRVKTCSVYFLLRYKVPFELQSPRWWLLQLSSVIQFASTGTNNKMLQALMRTFSHTRTASERKRERVLQWNQFVIGQIIPGEIDRDTIYIAPFAPFARSPTCRALRPMAVATLLPHRRHINLRFSIL